MDCIHKYYSIHFFQRTFLPFLYNRQDFVCDPADCAIRNISIKDGTDVNGIMRDMMSVLLEGALDEELDEELGYSKYDYRNKENDEA